MKRAAVIFAGLGALCLAVAPTAPSLPAAPESAGPVAGAETGAIAFDPADPLAGVRRCRAAAEKLARHYRCRFVKQERIGGELRAPETIQQSVRAEPYAVRLCWDGGARPVFGSKVEGLVFRAGENGNRMQVWRPSAPFLRLMDVPPTADAARSSARYTIAEASLAHGARRTERAYETAIAAGKLHVKVEPPAPVPELDGAVCWKLTRTVDPPAVDAFTLAEPAPPGPADEKIAAATVYFDAATGLQVGTRLVNPAGELVGAYWFTRIELDAKFAADEFTAAGLGR